MATAQDDGPGSRSSFAVGLCILLGVVCLWTISSFLTSGIMTGADTYNKPFAITWLCTASFTFYLLPPAFAYIRGRRRGNGATESDKAEAESATYAPVPSQEGDSEGLPSTAVAAVDRPLTTRETAQLAALFCLLWFAANYAMNAALALTTVSSMTVLSATSGFFTLLLGKLAGVEAFNLAKMGAVLLSIIGVVLVSESDNSILASDGTLTPAPDHHPHRLIGDGLALTSALLYACYVILLKLRIGDESRISMPLFFGFVGAFNVLALWPFGLILHFTGVEPFTLPPTGQIWLGVLINAFITFLSDYLYILAMLKTTPLLVTVGLSLTIPAAVVGDLAEGTRLGNRVLFLIGAVLVVAAFVVVGFSGTPLSADPVEGQEGARHQPVPTEDPPDG